MNDNNITAIPHPANKFKNLVLGAGGMLATSLENISFKLNRNNNWIFLTEQQLDITNHEAVQNILIRLKPDWVINAAAYTDVDAAESDYAEANAVNHTAVTNLVELCSAHKIKLLHISTDYVFNGIMPSRKSAWSEDDTPDPVNNYGKSKLAGEQSIINSDIHFIIARSSWLFAEHGNNFITKMYRLFRDKKSLSIVDDQTGKPTYTDDLAYMLINLIQCDYQGIVHVCNQGIATWYQLACTLKDLLKSDMEIIPCTTSDYPTPAKRPVNSALDCTLLESLISDSVIMRPWQKALAEAAGKLMK